MAAYIELFEEQFSSVVAEERYVQVVQPWRGNPTGPDDDRALDWQEPGEKKGGFVISRRQLVSDVLLVQVKARQWTGYRDVAIVDGRAVRDRAERVRDLFLSGASDRDAQLRRVVEESARYNLGDFKRNLNIPTMTLSLMRRVNLNRFQFKRQKDEKIDGQACYVLSFREVARPTLVSTVGGADIPIEGRVWLDRRGRVARTEVRFSRSETEKRVLIRVDYRPQPPIDVLVPARMWEWYEGGDQLGRIGGDKTLVQCLATYGNFRQFRVTTEERLK